MPCEQYVLHPTRTSLGQIFEAKQIYPYIKEMSLLYLRYIDDVFMIWKGTKAELMTIIKDLNEKHKTNQI